MNDMQKLNFAEYILSGMPVEWAYLLAERSIFSANSGTTTAMNVGNAFWWGESPEGDDFWRGVFYAFLSEERAS